MSDKEATARIKINKLLEAAGWRFFADGGAPANIRLEPSVTIKSTDLDALGDNFEKALAKSADTIAFFKVENDGFGLGAQRRAIEKNDLPQVQAELAAYLQALRSGEPSPPGRGQDEGSQPTCGLIVPKEKIAANGDYNLSGERYREDAVLSTHFPWRTVESLVETVTPPIKIQKTAFGTTGRFPVIDQSQDAIAGWTDDETALVRPTKPLVIFGDHIVAEIEAEQALVAANRALITRFEQKIQAALARIWGEQAPVDADKAA